MTEEEKWKDCRSVGMALQLLNRTAKSVNPGWRRKFRLCACYLLRRRERVMPDGRFANALDVAEQHFDGEATRAQLEVAIAEAQRGYEVHRSDLENDDERAAQGLGSLLNDSPSACVGTAINTAYGYFSEEGNRDGLALLRELFGNPFRPVEFSADWRTDTAVALAEQMYDSREFSAMPILADALQDAGCDNEDVLSTAEIATKFTFGGAGW